MPDARPLSLVVAAGMIDAKLAAKLSPILSVAEVGEVHLIRRQPFAGDKITCHCPPRALSGIKIFAEFWRFWTLFLLCWRHPQVVAIGLGVVPNGWYVAVAAAANRIPSIVHTMGKNDFNLSALGWPGRALSLWSVRRAGRVAVRGSSAEDWLAARGIPREHIFIQHNLHDFERFAPNPSLPKDFDLIYVGLLARYKRLDLMLDMLARACRARPATRLALVGDGPLQGDLEERARELGIAGQIHFAGRVPFAQLPGWYNRARLFVMTSDGEGLPQAMIEALSCGLPVIMPRDADIADLAQHEVNALLYPVRDTDACAEAALRLSGDDALYQRLRGGALALRTERAAEYGLTVQSELWRSALRSVVAERQGPRIGD